MIIICLFFYSNKKKYIVDKRLKCQSSGISECVKSYGENCKHPCSQHCINQTCDRFTGKCLSWCQDGFYGEKCKQGYSLF